MTFKQHQKFLLVRKKYYSFYYQKILYSKFSSQHFLDGSNSFLGSSNHFYKQISGFQFPIKKSSVLNSSKFIITTKNLIRFTNKMYINTLAKRQKFIRNSLKGILLVNFPEKEKNFLIKNLAAENKIALISQSASLLLKDSRNMDDLLGVDDPIQILFDRVKTCLPCICFINNLDSIGKQRYQQEQKSFYDLDHNFAKYHVSRTINEKQWLTLPTISFFGVSPSKRVFNNSKQDRIRLLSLQKKNTSSRDNNKASLFDHDFQQMIILKRLRRKITQPYHSFYMHKNWKRDQIFNVEHLFFSFTGTVNKSLVAVYPHLETSLLNLFKCLNKQPCLKLLKDGRGRIFCRLRPHNKKHGYFKRETTTNFKRVFKLSKTNQNFNNGYYNRLPFWLSKNSFFSKTNIDQIKLLHSFYGTKSQEENLLTSQPLKVNPLPSQTDFSQTQNDKIRLMFEKTKHNRADLHQKTGDTFSMYRQFFDANRDSYFSSNMKNNSSASVFSFLESAQYPSFLDADSKTRLENSYKIHSRPLFKNYSINYDSTEIFENKWKLISKINAYSPTWSKKNFFFKDLGKISIDKQKISQTSSNSTRESISYKRVGRKTDNYFSKNFDMAFNETPVNRKFTELSNPHLFSSTKRQTNKKFLPKITETEIIKRTALLKFLQILDGFHTTTGKRKNFSFTDLRVFDLGTQTKDNFQFKTSFKHQYLQWFKKFIIPFGLHLTNIFFLRPQKINVGSQNMGVSTSTPKMVLTLPEKKNLEPFQSKSNMKYYLSSKNILLPIIFREKPNKYPKAIMINLIGNNKLFPKIARFEKLLAPIFFLKRKSSKKIQQYNTYATIMSFQYKNNFLSYPSIKKADFHQSLPFDLSKSNIDGNRDNYFSSNMKNKRSASVFSDVPPVGTDASLFLKGKNRDAYFRPSLLFDISKDNIDENRNSYFSFNMKNKRLISQSISLPNKVPIWELYLKNQPSLKSLNLLCVWPSYIEEILGPFNFNDGASYLLPEYFQLLSHGPKLKKQGVTIIASTNNLTTLDAALLRPGRFDTVINFSHSFSSINRSCQTLKHSPSLVTLPSFCSQVYNQQSLIQNKIFSFSERSMKEKETVNFSIRAFNYFKNSMANQKNFFLEKNRNFLFNNTILIPLFFTLNIYKTIKNQFNLHVAVLDKPNSSIPLKTFIDVSVFIQYKLWWNSTNSKLSWLGLYEKPKTNILNFEKFKIFQPFSIKVILKSKTFKIIDLIGILRNILHIIYFKLFYMIFKTKLTDFGLSLSFNKSKVDINNNKNANLLSSNKNNDCESFAVCDPINNKIKNESPVFISKSEEARKLFHMVDFYSLKQNYKLKKDTWTLANLKNKTVKSFISNFHTEHKNMFLKYNRRLLFCIGDIDNKTYSKKDFDFILTNTNNTRKSQAIKSIKTQTVPNYFNYKKSENLKSKFRDSVKLIDVATTFLDQSSKTWKHDRKAVLVKNNNRNCTMLSKYKEIYKIKKIKLKQSFFNLHPFTSFMLKRWPKIAKQNKLKRHLKISLVSVFSGLENKDVLFFDIYNGLTWKNQIDNCLKTDQKFLTLQQFDQTLQQFDQSYCNDNIDFLKPVNSFNGQITFSEKHQHLIDDTTLYSQIYGNLYNVALLMPITTSLLKNESLKTFKTNNFFSTYEFYLFRKLTQNSSLNIICLQIGPLLIDLKKKMGICSLKNKIKHASVFYRKQKKMEADFGLSLPFDKSKGNIDGNRDSYFSSNMKNKHSASVFSDLESAQYASPFLKGKNEDANLAFTDKPLTWKNCIHNIDLPQTKKILKKIPRRIVLNHTYDYFKNIYKREYLNFITNPLKIDNNMILLKNLVSNEKKHYNLIKTLYESPFQSYKMYQTLLNQKKDASFQAKQWGGTQLDTSFFLLTFYNMFFEQIKHKKVIFNTIKIFMPYKSLVLSHFLLSQAKIYGFSCKNFEILIYNKFKNFLVNF